MGIRFIIILTKRPQRIQTVLKANQSQKLDISRLERGLYVLSSTRGRITKKLVIVSQNE